MSFSWTLPSSSKQVNASGTVSDGSGTSSRAVPVATWISPKHVAEMLDVSEATVWRWCKTLPAFPRPVKLSPGCTRFNLDQIAEYLRSVGDRT